MRYYKIEITKDGRTVLPASLKGQPLSSLTALGQFNPAALNIELDIPISAYATPDGYAYLQIQGLGLKDISSALDLNGCDIAFYGGMSKGLPLANPKQAGKIVTGQIFQAFGNWVGTQQSVDLILAPATGTPADPKNFIINWQANTSMADALKATLSTALPEANQQISISDKLVLNHDEVSYHATLNEVAALALRLSKSIITDPDYRGVQISYDGTRLAVTDLTTPTAPTKIAFQDLIGQPTWIEPNVIEFKTVMRADIELWDTINLPTKGLITVTTGAAFSALGGTTTFNGDYSVTSIHHYGSFRQPDAASWNTTFRAIPVIPDG